MGQTNARPGAALVACRGKSGVHEPVSRDDLQEVDREASLGHRSKIRLSQLPEVNPPECSPATEEDLSFISEWKPVPDLSPEDIVVVKGAWNRTIAWKDAAMEALAYKWAQLSPEVYDRLKSKWDELPQDIFLLIDGSVRALDKTTEVHHRESYTAGFPGCLKRDFGTTPSDILTYYAILGVRPKHWATLREAFLFAMKTHNPYMYADHDKRDLELGDAGAVARFAHLHLVSAGNAAVKKLIDRLLSPTAVLVHRQAQALASAPELAQTFYVRLLGKYPELLDYFAHADMDHLAQHMGQTIALIGTSGIALRDKLPTFSRLAVVHRQAMIPTFAFPLMGEVLLSTLRLFLEMEPEIVEAWKVFYTMAATIIQVPMSVEQQVYADAEEFFQTLARDEAWTPAQLEARLKEVSVEIGLTGTYRHTTEELQAGARIAWRNSPKCIGRIAWDTLVLRDCRHVTEPAEMMRQCHEHLRVATCKENITAVMTVFAPKKPGEKWGSRFWNSQLIRFAGYEQADGSVLGDTANVELTKVLMSKFGWVPPRSRSGFDVLPVVIDVPGRKPEIFELPPEIVHLVRMEHPRYPEITKLNLKWCAVPVITGFNMRVGGVDYPCCPFNGWFVDLEVARNLAERYSLGPKIAKICGYDTSRDFTGWRARIVADLCYVVTHSFQKAKFSLVDHFTASEQFLTHVDREKQHGREVPAQWSWIGGFAGVHCPVWHYEMRDFYLRPQYHYCADKWVVEGMAEQASSTSPARARDGGEAAGSGEAQAKRVLILYASETGTAERFAKRMAQELGLAYRPRVADLNSLDEDAVARCTHILLFVSTFGNGGPPKNGASLPECLPFRLERPRSGQRLKFAMMALGSSIYPHFCAFGKQVERVMLRAGGDCFMTSVWADEVKNQSDSFAHFLAGVRTELPPAPPPPDVGEAQLSFRFGSGAARLKPEESLAAAAASSGHHIARVARVEELLRSPEPGRGTRRIDVDISQCGLKYHTGGHLSVFPGNPDAEVVRLCKLLGVSQENMHAPLSAVMVEGDEEYRASLHFKPVSVFEMLKWHYDIKVTSSNLDDLLDLLLDVGAMSKSQRKVLGGEDKNQLVRVNWWVSALLEEFPAKRSRLTLEALVGKLSRQVPRLYSIASSSVVSPSLVSLCVGLVNVDQHRGLCSGMLHAVEPGDRVLVAVRDSSFTLPREPSAPLIMIGPGTGLAPFVGFMQERLHLRRGQPERKLGSARLFFGCRGAGEVLHADVCEEARDSGALSHYSVSFSREPGQPKTYVNDALLSDGEELWKVLQDPACHYYVCGDARMADSAYESLLQVIQTHGQLSRAKAVAYVDNMRRQGRYHLDVWGLVLHFQRARTLHQIKMSGKAKNWLKLVSGATPEQ